MKTKLKKLTIKRLRAIKKQILKEPRQFQMLRCFSERLRVIKQGSEPDRLVSIPNCGTAACIAGHACALFSERKKMNPLEASRYNMAKSRTSLSSAEYLLGCPNSAILFHFPRWPKQFQKHKHEGTPAFARQAAARIEWFIKTGGAE